MPPVKTQVACPNCRMPVMASIEQLFDVTQDPSAKQRFLSGRFNLIQCPSCQYQGQVSTLLLYHDADKELFISYAPMELALPQAEQEKVLGKLMNDVINKLPQEKRKAYLLNPKPALTMQGMVERVLEAEGVTKEMLDAQRAKAQLVQKILSAPEDQWPALVKEHDKELDATFFQLLTASAEATAGGGNAGAAQQMLAARNKLLDLSSFGARARQRQQTLEQAARELQGFGDKLTKDKMLELILKADDDDKVMAYVSLARPLLDYSFFEALTKRIDRATGADKERLSRLRESILQLTQEIDQVEQARMAEAAELLRTLLEAPDLREALMDNLPAIDDTFLSVLGANIDAANRAGRKDVVERLTRINDAIMALMQESSPPEIKLINELLQMESDAAAEAALKQRAAEITPQVVDAMTYIIDSLRQNNQAAAAERLEKLRGSALQQVMESNWRQ